MRLGGAARPAVPHLPWGDPRRGWDFVSIGPGDVRGRTASGRSTRSGTTARSVEWEDAGMDRLLGAPEALEYIRAARLRAADGVLRRRVQPG